MYNNKYMKHTKILFTTIFSILIVALSFFWASTALAVTSAYLQSELQKGDALAAQGKTSEAAAVYDSANRQAQAYLNAQNTSGPTDQAAYESQIRQMYTGYPGGTANGQSPASAAAGGCIGSFVGNWVGGIVSKGINSLIPQSAGELISIPTNDTQQKNANFRDETLNGIAFCIGNGLIDAMSASIVQWINNGFKNPDGTKGPGFVTNPNQFFRQIADREAGAFFQGLGPIGNVICKPFDLRIRLALLNEYNNNGYGQQQCTLSAIKQNFANLQNSGDYMSDWFQLTQQDNNNAIGSYFIARKRMADGITYNIAQNTLELNLGKGFLNLKKCAKYSTTAKDPNSGKPQCTEWQTTTPGAEVQASLDRAMGSKTHRIEIATNFNQIISALVNQIVIQAVEGLRKDNDYGNNSFDTGYADMSSYYDYNNINDIANPIYYPPTINSTSSATSTNVGTSTASTSYLFDSGYGVTP